MKKQLSLKELGDRLGDIDFSLITLLARRNELVREIARFKMADGQKIIRLNIENERIKAAKKLAKENGLDPNYAAQIMYSLINESCKQQLSELEKTFTRKN